MSRAQHIVGEWLQSVELVEAAFEQISVDHLGDIADWSRPDLLEWSVELFEALISALRAPDRNESALLVVPLLYSESLATVVPDFAELLSAEWQDIHVPGLYALNDLGILGWERGEEYRCDLSNNLVPAASVSYYRCWKTAEAEYERALYFLWSEPA